MTNLNPQKSPDLVGKTLIFQFKFLSNSFYESAQKLVGKIKSFCNKFAIIKITLLVSYLFLSRVLVGRVWKVMYRINVWIIGFANHKKKKLSSSQLSVFLNDISSRQIARTKFQFDMSASSHRLFNRPSSVYLSNISEGTKNESR